MPLKLRIISASKLTLITLIAVWMTINPVSARAANPDPVLQWIGIMNDTILFGGGTPLVTTRQTALVAASIFDAVNGIHPAYRYLFVKPGAPDHASQRAAAVQAAYVVLRALYPAQAGTLDTQYNAAIAQISATERARSVTGVAWGQSVATAILAIRSTDGLTPAPPPICRGPGHRNIGCSGRCVATDTPSGGLWRWPPICEYDPVGADTPFPISPPTSQFPYQCRVRSGLQRSQNHGQFFGILAHGRSVRTRALLGWKHTSLLE